MAPRHEWAVTRALDVPAVLKIEDCDESSERPVLVLEDFGGVSLDLDELARQVVARFKLDIERARCHVVVHGSPLWGCWDRSRLDQVLANLLANALKLGRRLPVEIATALQGDRAVLSVRDHGIGIDPAHQAQIFDRFQRAVSERHYGGLGLGLYICRQIVEGHGGSIRVESEPGAGARFFVELPVPT